MALFSIVEDQVNIITQGPLKQISDPIDVEGWGQDSTAAIEKFLIEGGDLFMQNESPTTLTIILTSDSANGRLQWQLAMAATQTLRSLTMTIDAVSGEIISIDQTT